MILMMENPTRNSTDLTVEIHRADDVKIIDLTLVLDSAYVLVVSDGFPEESLAF